MKTKSVLILFLCLILSTAFVFSSYAEVLPESSGAEAPAQNTGSAEEVPVQPAASNAESQDNKPQYIKGSPWDPTVIAGNLPEERPAEKDDFFASVNYDFLKQNKDTQALASNFTSNPAGSMKEAVTAILSDTSYSSPLLDNIRIMYNQALDTDTLLKQGLEEVKPYLNMIDSASTLAELTDVLTSGDFPFNPFILEQLVNNGTNGEVILHIAPNFLCTDPVFGVSDYNSGKLIPEDPTTWGVYINPRFNTAMIYMLYDGLDVVGCVNKFVELLIFESEYGKNAYSESLMNDIEYGAVSEFYEFLSMNDLEKKFGDFPIRKILEKEGRDGCSVYRIQSSKWAEAFSELYNNENLDLLKTIARYKVMTEVQSFTETGINALEAVQGKPDAASLGLTEEEFRQYEETSKQQAAMIRAYNAVSNLKTFSHGLGFIYSNVFFNQKDIDQLLTFCENIKDEYRSLFEKCDWIEESTKTRLIKKLDLMKFNMLEPINGYISFDGVQLKTSGDGGTLFGNYLIMKKYVEEKETELLGKKAMSDIIWYSFPTSTTNAFYNQDDNSVNLMPGLITETMFYADMPAEELFARIGNVLAHEISHAFDFSGSQYNEYAIPDPLFSEKDRQAFLDRQNKLVDYLSSMTIGDDIQIDGQHIITETGADLTGFETEILLAEKLGLNMERIYRSFASLYGQVFSAQLLQSLLNDTHALHYIRINTIVQMTDNFYKAFGVSEGDGMYLPKEKRISIW